MLTVIRSGLQTSVQDGGRVGYRSVGVCRSGALDLPALRIANLLVGNDQGDAALEIVLGQVSFEFTTNCWFALTGADCQATLDGASVWTGWRKQARAGQRLTLGAPVHGMRSYLAVAGGIDVPVVMGARSTDLGGEFGGFKGRKLCDGDSLSIGHPRSTLNGPQGVRQLLAGNRIRAIPGPEYQQFSDASRLSFWRQPWHLSPDSNRMGYRLQGQPLTRTSSDELLSHGLLPGVIQVPHNGLPIILMNDSQTTGGYPRIATVIEADRYHLAQLRLGEPIHFVQCSLEAALQADNALQSYFQQLAWQLQQPLASTKEHRRHA